MPATSLGLALGLPMPRVEVIEVSDTLIEQTDPREVFDLTPRRLANRWARLLSK